MMAHEARLDAVASLVKAAQKAIARAGDENEAVWLAGTSLLATTQDPVKLAFLAAMTAVQLAQYKNAADQ